MGGFTVILFDAVVEAEVLHALAYLTRCGDELIFASSCPVSVPANDISLLVWRLDSNTAAVHNSADNTRRVDARDSRRARAVALRQFADVLRARSGVIESAAAGEHARMLADAAAASAEDSLDEALRTAAETNAANGSDDKLPPLGDTTAYVSLGSGCAPLSPAPADAYQRDPKPAEAAAADAAAATAAADAAAYSLRSVQLVVADADLLVLDLLTDVVVISTDVGLRTAAALAYISYLPADLPTIGTI